jgi:two-component system cell cycle sensor histidine kinase/response regulator CckA
MHTRDASPSLAVRGSPRSWGRLAATPIRLVLLPCAALVAVVAGLILVSCGVATLTLRQGSAVQDRLCFRRVVQSETARGAYLLRDRLAEPFIPLRTLARKWDRAGEAHPGCLGLAWVGDPAGSPLGKEEEDPIPPSIFLLLALAGLVMASLLGVMVRVGRTAVRRAAALEREIHERRQAEQALRASEAKYRALIENLEQGVFLKDRNLCFVAVNRPFCEGLGCREADLIGQTDHRWYLKEQAEDHLAVELSVLEEGQRVEREEKLFLASQLAKPGEQSDTLVKNQARERTVRIIRTPVRDETGAIVGVLGICWDVTEQRALEEQLRQAQKMEAVGQLAGGIAHDFNNLLTAMLGNLSLIKMRHATDEPTHTLAATAEQAGLRASELTRQLLGLSRRNCHNPQALDLRVTVGEVLGLLQHTADPRIRWSVDLPPNLWTVRADPGQMNQVLMNLALNACDAMPEGGRLTFKAKNVTLEEADRRMHLNARPGEYVRLRVRDTGPGIPPELLGRVFEPFFTTKEPGKGTGLGLAMAFGIVQQHKGWMKVHSVVGKGTCFEVFLPRSQESAPSPGEGARTGEEAGKVPPRMAASGTILVIDDEAPIRTLARAVLTQAGYETLLAADGQEGVDLFAREPGRIGLVLLDLRMPNLSGQETFRRLRAIDPDVRVVFVSGYSFESLTQEEQQAARGFVAKPFQLHELLRCIREALEGSSSDDLPVAPSQMLSAPA